MNGSFYVVVTLILRLLFLPTFVYALLESKHKWRTALYTVAVMASILPVGFVLSLFVGMPVVIGTILAPMLPIAGMATALAHGKGKFA